jgi:hypothetical protein
LPHRAVGSPNIANSWTALPIPEFARCTTVALTLKFRFGIESNFSDGKGVVTGVKTAQKPHAPSAKGSGAAEIAVKDLWED